MNPTLPEGPAYRIDTPRLRLRCWAPSDASLQQRAVERNLAHLRPWMVWAAYEPLTFPQRVARLRAARGDFDLGRDYTYGVFDPAEGVVLGGTGLHRRPHLTAGREIGYWVDRGHLRRGFATEITSALVRVAFEVEGLACVQIRCAPENEPSARIPRRLGFAPPVLEPESFELADGTLCDTLVFTLRAEGYRASPASQLPIAAYDVLGERIL